MKTLFLRACALCFAALIAILACCINAVAVESEVYNWYCVHRKDHKQPVADNQFSFLQDHGGFYIDPSHGDECEDKIVYLTFDAGYENGNVEKILNVLKEKNVPAAFFVLGNLIEKNTDLILRMYDEGHLVCNHTYSHAAMVGKTKAEFMRELDRLEQTCLEKTGKSLARYYRPPEGKFDLESLTYADEMGYKTIFWSFAYADWDNNRQMSMDSAKKKILDNIHNGEVMLLHPTSATNAAILGDVIDELRLQGYRFGTLDELCKGD
jgi:peptidoglycan-N-acetylmuramic acid deacetylase